MAKKYKVMHPQGTPFKKGQKVTDDEIIKAGYHVPHWLAHKVIQEIGGTDQPTKAGRHSKKPANPAPAPAVSTETSATHAATPATDVRK